MLFKTHAGGIKDAQVFIGGQNPNSIQVSGNKKLGELLDDFYKSHHEELLSKQWKFMNRARVSVCWIDSPTGTNHVNSMEYLDSFIIG